MKTTILLTLGLFISFSAFSQMSDGKYKYANNEVTLTFNISDDGWTISDVILTNNITKSTLQGKGETMQANDMFWYQFQTTECNYEFDVPDNKLTLSEFDCKIGKKAIKYQLIKKI